MAHNIDTSTGRPAIAFLGSRDNIWHRLGTEKKPGATIKEWTVDAGLDWYVELVDGFAGREEMLATPFKFNVRSDTRHVLGVNKYNSDEQLVQPSDILGYFEEYISADPRFQLDVAGSLKKGEIIWATAKFNGNMKVGGDDHTARLLMSTAFDGTMSTFNLPSMTRVICNNTFNAAICDGHKEKCIVKTSHRSKFNKEKVGKELQKIIQGFENYKEMGNAMAQVELSRSGVNKFFRAVLDIEQDAKDDDISTRKQNQFKSLLDAMETTLKETNGQVSAWSAFNAVTRYVDHDRGTRDTGNGADEGERRFLAAQYGAGATMKQKAVELITEDNFLKFITVEKKVSDDDVTDILRSSFRPQRWQ